MFASLYVSVLETYPCMLASVSDKADVGQLLCCFQSCTCQNVKLSNIRSTLKVLDLIENFTLIIMSMLQSQCQAPYKQLELMIYIIWFIFGNAHLCDIFFFNENRGQRSAIFYIQQRAVKFWFNYLRFNYSSTIYPLWFILCVCVFNWCFNFFTVLVSLYSCFYSCQCIPVGLFSKLFNLDFYIDSSIPGIFGGLEHWMKKEWLTDWLTELHYRLSFLRLVRSP